MNDSLDSPSSDPSGAANGGRCPSHPWSGLPCQACGEPRALLEPSGGAALPARETLAERVEPVIEACAAYLERHYPDDVWSAEAAAAVRQQAWGPVMPLSPASSPVPSSEALTTLLREIIELADDSKLALIKTNDIAIARNHAFVRLSDIQAHCRAALTSHASQAQELAALQKKLDDEIAHSKTLNDWTRGAVEIASVFQSGGALADKLTLGSSTVHDGMRWLLAERAALQGQIAALREREAAFMAHFDASQAQETETKDPLAAPCSYCGYNGPNYWQRRTHNPACRWYLVGGERERRAALGESSPSAPQETP